MRKATIIIAIILSAANAYSQHPFVQNLNDIATITFPDTPKANNIKGYTLYILKKNDLAYLAEASSIRQGLRDLLSPNGLDSTYNGFIQGFVSSSNGKLLYKKNTSSNGLNGIEFECLGSKNNRKFYSRNRLFFCNNILIDYSVLSADSVQSDDKRVSTFFNSFKLTIKKTQIRQDNFVELGYRAGKIIGVLLVLAVISSIGGLIVFLIIKLTKG